MEQSDFEWRITDTETAGLEGGVCDVAVRAIDKDFNLLWERESLIDPERPISPGASGVHGIVDEMVVDMPTLQEYVDVYGNPFTSERLVVVGHNIQFDIRMLGAVLPVPHRKLCTLKLAKLVWPEGMDDYKLQTLRYTFRLEAGDAHRAMGDVITCHSLLKVAGEKLGTDMYGLMDFCRKPLPKTTKFPCGKHKGTMLKDLPGSYVSWALVNMTNLDDDLKEALQAL